MKALTALVTASGHSSDRFLYVVLVIGASLIIRVAIFRVRRRRRAQAQAGEGATPPVSPAGRARAQIGHRVQAVHAPASLGDVGEIAMREVKERVRGRIFRVGTLLILVIVALAIIIPTLTKSSNSVTPQTVGLVGGLSSQGSALVKVAAQSNDDHATFVTEASLDKAKAGLRSGRIDLAIVNGDEVLLNEPATAKNSPADAPFVADVAEYLGVVNAYHAAGLTPDQMLEVTNSKSVPVHALKSGSSSGTKTTSVIGIVLLFFMLTQYCTWTLIGVMQEKSSRVVEVILATVRPIELLGGKVLGIGIVALSQATVIVGFALVVASATGSDLLKGAAPIVLLSELLWLILGYAFYCWVYAAAGSTAERQDQVQTLALPLSIPILIAYIFSITVASSGDADVLFKILAYVPFTAPFCMSALVGLGDVAWWQFLASVLITLAGTVAMALFAARIYRRAVLRTGSRVHLHELFARSGNN